ncbi:MAG: hypothetical protein ABIS92_15640 [Polyangia bacterium]
MKIKNSLLVLAALVTLGGLAGCGKTSYFEVALYVDSNVPGVNATCLFKLNQCEVMVKGAGGESFTLNSSVCHAPTGYNLGVFQYATDEESGDVSFHVMLTANVDGVPTNVGSGDSTPTPIKSGMRQQVAVTVKPDVAALKCNTQTQ